LITVTVHYCIWFSFKFLVFHITLVPQIESLRIVTGKMFPNPYWNTECAKSQYDIIIVSIISASKGHVDCSSSTLMLILKGSYWDLPCWEFSLFCGD